MRDAGWFWEALNVLAIQSLAGSSFPAEVLLTREGNGSDEEILSLVEISRAGVDKLSAWTGVEAKTRSKSGRQKVHAVTSWWWQKGAAHELSIEGN